MSQHPSNKILINDQSSQYQTLKDEEQIDVQHASSQIIIQTAYRELIQDQLKKRGIFNEIFNDTEPVAKKGLFRLRDLTFISPCS